MTLTLYQVDAFARQPFKGNPAAVVPLQRWLPENLMQQIAMENNLSETAFLVKDAQAAESRYHIRWFTPGSEVDLCGHATLASAFVIKNFLEPEAETIHFTTEKAGPLEAIATKDVYTLNFPSRMPQPCAVPVGLLECLGVTEAVEVLLSRDYFVVLPNEEAVRNLQPDFNRMKMLDSFGVIVTAKGNDADAVSRCFYPAAGINEDPVTGSAHCNVVPYWAEKLGKNQLFCRQLSSRGGNLHCTLKNGRVYMSGGCVLFLKGEILLDAYGSF